MYLQDKSAEDVHVKEFQNVIRVYYMLMTMKFETVVADFKRNMSSSEKSVARTEVLHNSNVN